MAAWITILQKYKIPCINERAYSLFVTFDTVVTLFDTKFQMIISHPLPDMQ